MIATNDRAMSVPSTGPAFQEYSAKILLEAIGEGLPYPLILSSLPFSSTNETLNFRFPLICFLQHHVPGLVRSLGKYS